jgi:chemotaxis protein histidine kinase CheA
MLLSVRVPTMDDLLREFLTETNESLDVVDVELVRFEQDPNNAGILGNIFRLVHTIKGTCGFLGLPRLEALAHAAETLMGKYRDGAPVTGEGVTLILFTIDRLKEILGDLEGAGAEPDGDDGDLISQLEASRRWSARCVPARFRSTSWSAPSAKRRRRLRPPRCRKWCRRRLPPRRSPPRPRRSPPRALPRPRMQERPTKRPRAA